MELFTTKSVLCSEPLSNGLLNFQKTPKAECFFQVFIKQYIQSKQNRGILKLSLPELGKEPTDKHAAVNEEEIQLKFLVQGQISRAKACFEMSLCSFVSLIYHRKLH